MKNKPFIFLVFLCLFLGIIAAAQNPHPYFRNYNTDHGLPSSEVHYALQDDDGYMWFATDNGLSRFDGYTFKNYGRREGLKDNVVFYLQKAPDGKIWMATMSGALFLVEGDSIITYKQNELLVDFVDEKLIADFYIDGEATPYLSVHGKGIIQIDQKGQHLFIQNNQPLGGGIVWEHPDGKILCSNSNAADSLRQRRSELFYSKDSAPPIECTLNKSSFLIENIPFIDNSTGEYIGIIGVNDSTYLVHLANYLFEMQHQNIVWGKTITHIFQMKAILIEKNGQILQGLLRGNGLRKYRNFDQFKNDIYEQYLLGRSITHVFQDKQGGYWISTIEHGVFYCADFDQKIYDRSFGFPNEDVRCLTFKNKNELYLGFRTGEILALNTNTEKAKHFESSPATKQDIIYDLYFDPFEHRLWMSSRRVKYWEENRWKKIDYEILPSLTLKTWFLVSKRFTVNKDDNMFWFTNLYGFGSVNMTEKQVTENSRVLNKIERTFIARKVGNGQVWIGNTSGFFEYKDGRLLRPTPFHDAFQTRVEDIAEMQDGTLVVCTKGEGVLLWKDSFFLQLTTDDGLLTNMIENVHVDEQNRIWIGTLQGLNRISFPYLASLAKPKVERFTIWHGLPSNEINQVRSYGGQVWIATNRGLMKWKEPRRNTSINPPVLRQLQVNNQTIEVTQDAVFSHAKNDFSFQFVTINYRINGNILYRYRMNGEHWTETKQTNINFARLSPDVYTFEVQSENEDGIWSDSAVFSFCINFPWWQQWWFYILSILAVLMGSFGIYKRQMYLFKEEYELKDQVKELEKKALQAQMNPHFIFNCLTSIQRLVMDKETDNAMRYLSRFAKLVRGTLNASIQGEISLEEEIEMLESYLQLEKLRFKSAFEYTINVDSSLDVFDITFPSMLLQPYVENAIIHGMQGKESGGKITIDFKNQDGSLIATICDNGGGMQASSKLNPLHKSVGMSITSHRLKLLHDGEENDFVQVSDILGENKEVFGIKVRVVLNKSA